MNILLAVDGSPATEKAVQFVGQLLGSPAGADVALTVFHVVESLPAEFVEHRPISVPEQSFENAVESWEAARCAAGRELIEQQVRQLQEAGLPKSAMTAKCVSRDARPGGQKVVAARAIIDEMKQGDYDIVCLGRRGTRAASGSFIGSVAEKVLREAEGRTVWVVD